MVFREIMPTSHPIFVARWHDRQASRDRTLRDVLFFLKNHEPIVPVVGPGLVGIDGKGPWN